MDCYPSLGATEAEGKENHARMASKSVWAPDRRRPELNTGTRRQAMLVAVEPPVRPLRSTGSKSHVSWHEICRSISRRQQKCIHRFEPSALTDPEETTPNTSRLRGRHDTFALPGSLVQRSQAPTQPRREIRAPQRIHVGHVPLLESKERHASSNRRVNQRGKMP